MLALSSSSVMASQIVQGDRNETAGSNYHYAVYGDQNTFAND